MISIHTPIWQLLFRELGTENRRGFNALNGLLSFLLVCRKVEHPNEKMCVNALNGLLSFLRRKERKIMSKYRVCQRPERASFISTEEVIRDEEDDPFGCQRPERASFISTWSAGGCSGHRSSGVNALNGLLSFLRRTWRRTFCSDDVVSTPWTGFFHFYAALYLLGIGTAFGVSTPWTGFFHFYCFLSQWLLFCSCVNALNGLLSFLRNRKCLRWDRWWGVNALNGLLSFLP